MVSGGGQYVWLWIVPRRGASTGATKERDIHTERPGGRGALDLSTERPQIQDRVEKQRFAWFHRHQHTFNIIQHTFNIHSTHIQHTFNIGTKSNEILCFLHITVNLEVSGSKNLFILNKIEF